MSTPEQLVREIKQLQDRLNQAKESKARLQGSLDAALAELKRLGCASATVAEKKAAQLQAQAAELQEEISNGLSKLREEYGW